VPRLQLTLARLFVPITGPEPLTRLQTQATEAYYQTDAGKAVASRKHNICHECFEAYIRSCCDPLQPRIPVRCPVPECSGPLSEISESVFKPLITQELYELYSRIMVHSPSIALPETSFIPFSFSN
jgi:hypothetical protein